VFNRAATRRLARQSEAPLGRNKRRDPHKQCPHITKVTGGVKGGRAPDEEASSSKRFRNGGKHPD